MWLCIFNLICNSKLCRFKKRHQINGPYNIKFMSLLAISLVRLLTITKKLVKLSTGGEGFLLPGNNPNPNPLLPLDPNPPIPRNPTWARERERRVVDDGATARCWLVGIHSRGMRGDRREQQRTKAILKASGGSNSNPLTSIAFRSTHWTGPLAWNQGGWSSILAIRINFKVFKFEFKLRWLSVYIQSDLETNELNE